MPLFLAALHLLHQKLDFCSAKIRKPFLHRTCKHLVQGFLHVACCVRRVTSSRQYESFLIAYSWMKPKTRQALRKFFKWSGVACIFSPPDKKPSNYYHIPVCIYITKRGIGQQAYLLKGVMPCNLLLYHCSTTIEHTHKNHPCEQTFEEAHETRLFLFLGWSTLPPHMHT